MAAVLLELPSKSRRVEGRVWVGSVSSLIQEATVRLLDATTVSNPPDY